MGLKFAGRLAAAVLTLGAMATAGQAMAQTYTSRVEKVVTYTANGKVQTEADGKNNLTTYEYDGFDRLVKVRYPDPNTPGVSSTTDYEQYGYDAAGNRTSWRRRSGETAAFTYDALNRAMSGLRGEAYTYDNLGRRTDAAYNGYTHQAAYDALGRTTLERTNALTVSYEYDLAGRRTKITWPDGVFARYDRHVTGEVSTIHENGLNLLVSYAYDDLGRVASRTYANGTDTSYGYDAASRLAQLNLNVAGTDKDQAWTFAYNAAGQVITRTAANGLYEWTQSQASKTYGVNGLNQLTSAGGAAVSYDLRGNLSLNGGVTHGYDLANNLTATSGGAVLAYEPTGRLWQVSAGGATTQFLYAGSDLIAEYGPGGLLRRYVPGDGVDQPLVWYEGAGLSDRRFLLQDAQGSVAAVTNGAGAATINSYDEYGVPAATNQGRFQYTGQIWMPEVGLYHYKARAYSPTLGRFLQTDPIGYDDGLNWYAYVGNDPVNHADPTGTEITCDANGENCHEDEPIVVTARKANVGDKIVAFFAGNSGSISAYFGPNRSNFGGGNACLYAGKQANSELADGLSDGGDLVGHINDGVDGVVLGDRAAAQAWARSAGRRALGGVATAAEAGGEYSRARAEMRGGKPTGVAAAGGAGRFTAGQGATAGGTLIGLAAAGPLGAIGGGVLAGLLGKASKLDEDVGRAAEAAVEGCR